MLMIQEFNEDPSSASKELFPLHNSGSQLDKDCFYFFYICSRLFVGTAKEVSR